jgi:GAF domain-containing protein
VTLALIIESALVALAFVLAAWWRVGNLRATAERDRAFDALAAEARLERALREVALAADGESPELDVAAVVADRLGELLDAATSAVIRAEPESLHIIGYRGPTPFPERLPWDESSSSAEAVRSGQPARLERYDPQGGTVGSFIAEHGLRCGISVPVRTHGRVWGCITVTTPREGGFSAQEEDWLERFARLASAALANAEAQGRLREEAKLERTLQEVTVAGASGELSGPELFALVAERVAGLVGADGAMVVRLQGSTGRVVGVHSLEPMPEAFPVPESSAASLALQSGSAARIDDYQALRDGDLGRATATALGYRSSVVAPVGRREDWWGYIAVGQPPAEVVSAAD